MLNGIDIASYQEGLSPSAMFTTDFIIVKATGNTWYRNPSFNRHADETLASGKLLGCYHFAYESGPWANPEQEADYFLDAVKPYIGKATLWLDYEMGALDAYSVAWCKRWLEYVKEKTGTTPGIYMSKGVCRSMDWASVASDYPLWAAQYPNYDETGYQDDPWTDAYGFGAWYGPTIYQYTSSGRIPGYGGHLDLDLFHGTADDWRKLIGHDKKGEYMGRIQKMVDKAKEIANNDWHGYDWDDRWVQDLDCSSLQYICATDAGYDVGGVGPDKTRYTGTMIDDFTRAGFTVHKPGEVDVFPGCIFLRDPWGAGGHTEMYVGDGMNAGAHCSETGGVHGEPGDQTGNEISIAPDPGGWDYVLVPPTDEVPKAWDLITWGSNGGDNQRFELMRMTEDEGGDLYAIRCKADGRFLDVEEAKDEDGTRVILYSDYHGGPNQLWRIASSGEGDGCIFIQSAMMGCRVLDVVGADPNPGGSLCICKRKAENSANQKWVKLDNYDGTFTFINNGFASKLVLDSKGGGR